jgi:hypothetical protein
MFFGVMSTGGAAAFMLISAAYLLLFYVVHLVTLWRRGQLPEHFKKLWRFITGKWDPAEIKIFKDPADQPSDVGDSDPDDVDE